MKNTMIWVLLAILLPVTQALAGGSSTPYYWAKVSVPKTEGAGKVYVGDSTTPSYKTSDTSYSAKNKNAGGGLNFYVAAQHAYGYKFTTWQLSSGGFSAGSLTSEGVNTWRVTVNSSSDGEGNAVNYTATPKYTAYDASEGHQLTLDASVIGLGSYSVTSAPEGFPKADLLAGKSVVAYPNDALTITATAAAGYDFVEWKRVGASGASASEKFENQTFAEDTTVSAVFKQQKVVHAYSLAPVGGTYKVDGQTVGMAGGDKSNFATVSATYSEAVAEEGYEFVGWYRLHENGVKEYLSYYKEVTISENDDITVGADFKKKADITLTFSMGEGDAYVADGVKVDGETVSTTYAAVGTTTVSLSTEAEPTKQPKWWYILDSDEQKVYFSYSRTTEWTFAENATVGVDFFHTTSSLAKLIEDATGDTLTLTGNVEVADETVCEIPAGKTVVVPTNVTLYVDGALTVFGSIVLEEGGKVSKCLKLLKQKGDGLSPIQPAGATEKYWKTSQAESHSTVGSWAGETTTHLTVVRGDGTFVRGATGITDDACWVTCTYGSGAENHIITIGYFSTSSSIGSPTDIWSGGDKDCILLKETKIAGPSHSGDGRLAYAKKMECAGCKAWLDADGCKYADGNKDGSGQVSSNFKGRFFNASEISFTPKDYWQRGDAWFYNCTNVTVTKIKNNQNNELTFYDCGPKITVSNSGSGVDVTYKIYGGKYDVDLSSGMYTRGTDETDYPTGIYGGAFKTNQDNWRGASIRNSKKFYQHADGYWYLDENQEMTVAKIATKDYLWFKDGPTATSETALGYLDEYSAATIVLMRNVSVSEPYTLAAGKSLVIDLNGYTITAPKGFIKNHGNLEIRDSNGRLSGCGVDAGEAMVVETFDGGSTKICYGSYTGNFVVNAGGALTTYHGNFGGSFENKGGTLDLLGGIFAQDVSALIPSGYLCFSRGSSGYRVGLYPWVEVSEAKYENQVNYGLKAIKSEYRALYLNNRQKTLSGMGDDVDSWHRVAELRAAYDYYMNNGCIDVMVEFDRDVESGMEAIVSDLYSVDVPATPAHTRTRVLSSNIGAGYAQISYLRFADGDMTALSGSLVNSSAQNVGTTCRFMMELFTLKNFRLRENGKYVFGDNVDPWFLIADQRFVIGAGTKAAMIQKEGGADFFETVQAAVDAVAEGGTVKLCNDVADSGEVVVERLCSIDLNGFSFAGTFKAPAGYEVVEADGVVSFKPSGVTVSVPAVAHMTAVVKVGDTVIEPVGGVYTVAPDAIVTVIYTAETGYMGSFTRTVDTSVTTTVDVSDVVAQQIVAKIGETPFASLAEAIEGMQSGDEIVVVAESVLTVGGYEMTVTAGKLTLAVGEDRLEFKDGTDATIAWPTAEAAKDVIVVSGGKYSSDPTAFLADGLEAKKKGAAWVVGVKVVIPVDDTKPEAEQNVETIVTTDDQTSKVDEQKVTDVIEQAIPTTGNETDEEKQAKQDLVQNINTNTTVEGVKLTTVDEKVVDEQTQIEEIVKTNGVKAVVLAAKAAAQETAQEAASKNEEDKTSEEKTAEAFKAAIEQTAKDSEITVKVEVQATLVEYKPPVAESVENKTGSIEFELKPEATVTVTVKDEPPVTQKVEVSNDMIDQTQKIKVSMYAGFRPVQVLHRDDDGLLIEEFTGDQIGYDEQTGIVTVLISHFSYLQLNQKANVARVDGTDYSSLADAVAAANGKTVSLLTDVALDAALTVAEGASVTIDFAGQKVSWADGTTDAEKAKGLIVNNGTLALTDGSDAGNGGLDAGSGVLTTVGATAVTTAISSGSYDGTFPDSAKVVVSGGSFSVAVPAQNCAPGYEAGTKGSDGRYGVAEQPATVTAVIASARDPWNGLVDIVVTLTSKATATIVVSNLSAAAAIPTSELKTMSADGSLSAFDGTVAGAETAQTLHLVWNSTTAVPSTGSVTLGVAATSLAGKTTAQVAEALTLVNTTPRVAGTEVTVTLPAAWGVTGASTVLKVDGTAVSGDLSGSTYVWNTESVVPGEHVLKLVWNGNEYEQTFVIGELVRARWSALTIDNTRAAIAAKDIETLPLPAGWNDAADGAVTLEVLDADDNVLETQQATSGTQQWVFNTASLVPRTYKVRMSYAVGGVSKSETVVYSIGELVRARWSALTIDNTRAALPAKDDETLPLPAGWQDAVDGVVKLEVLDKDGNVLDTKNVSATDTQWTLDTRSLVPGEYTVRMTYRTSAGEQIETVKYDLAVLVRANWSSLTIDNTRATLPAKDDETLPMPATWGDVATAQVKLEVLDADGHVLDTKYVDASAAQWTLDTRSLLPGAYTVRMTYPTADGEKVADVSYEVGVLVEAEWSSLTIDNRRQTIAAKDDETLPMPANWNETTDGKVKLEVLDADGNVLDTLTADASATSWTLDTRSLLPGGYTVRMTYLVNGATKIETVSYDVAVLVEADWSSLTIDNRLASIEAKDTESLALPAAWGESPDKVVLTVVDADGKVVHTETVAGTEKSWTWSTVPVLPGTYSVNMAWPGATGDTNAVYTIAMLEEGEVDLGRVDNKVGVRDLATSSPVFQLKWPGTTNAVLTLDGENQYAIADANGLWTWNTNGLGYGIYTFTNVVDGVVYEAKFRLDGEILVNLENGKLPVDRSWYTNHVGEIAADATAKSLDANLKQPTVNGAPYWQNYVLGWSPTNADERLLVRLTGYDKTANQLSALLEGKKDDRTEFGNMQLQYVLRSGTNTTGTAWTESAPQPTNTFTTPFTATDGQKYYKGTIILTPKE